MNIIKNGDPNKIKEYNFGTEAYDICFEEGDLG